MEDNHPKIKPSHRSELVQEYYFSRKLKEVDSLKKAGADIINLGIGSPDMPPSDDVLTVLREAVTAPENHGYQSYNGIPELRQAFADWYIRYYGVKLDYLTEILPLIGSKEGVMHITMAFVNSGESVLVPDPGYPTYSSVSKLVGANVRSYSLSEERQWLPDFEKLENEGLEGVKLMWVNYPHMPTGASATKELFEKLIKFGKKHNILICNDNPYSFILNENYLSILSVEGAKDVALELNSLSKSHNMPGWRIGMVAGAKEYISAVVKIKSNMDSGMFRPMQLAAAKALSVDSDWYNSINMVYIQRRALAEKILEMTGCSYDKKQSGLFLWGRVSDKYSSGEELADKLLYEANIFITPGKVFGSNGEKYIRISLCSDTSKLNESIERVSKIL